MTTDCEAEGKGRAALGPTPRRRSFISGFRISVHGLAGFLLRGTLGGVGLKLLSIMLAFGISVLLARQLGPGGYGVYSYVLSLVMLLTVPARFGLTSLVIRETVKAKTQANWPLLNGLWRWSDLWVLLSSLAMILLGLLGIQIFQGQLPEDSAGTAIWGLPLIPALAFLALRGAALQGLRRVVIGQMPDLVLRQAVFLLAVLAASLIMPEWLEPERVMQLHVMAALIALLIAITLRRQAQPSALELVHSHVMKVREWLRSALPLALAEGSRILHMQIGILVIGQYHGADQVGLYQVAAQLSVFVSFLLAPLGQAMAPDIARFYQAGAIGRVRRLVIWGALACGASALMIALPLLLLGRPLLAGLYGTEFAGAYPAMALLGLNYLVMTSFGPIGPVLNMIGCENANLRAAMAGTFTNVISCFLLVPAYATTGAALSMLLSGVMVGLIQVSALKIKLGADRRQTSDGLGNEGP